MSFRTRRIGAMESLEPRQLMAADAFASPEPAVEPQAMIFVQIPSMGDNGLKAENTANNAGDWYIADSFGFGVEREMKESSASREPTTDLAAVDSAFEDQPLCYLKYKLDRCFVKSWSTSGDADDRPTEEVAFYYNKIAFTYAKTLDGDSWDEAILANPDIRVLSC